MDDDDNSMCLQYPTARYDISSSSLRPTLSTPPQKPMRSLRGRRARARVTGRQSTRTQMRAHRYRAGRTCRRWQSYWAASEQAHSTEEEKGRHGADMGEGMSGGLAVSLPRESQRYMVAATAAGTEQIRGALRVAVPHEPRLARATRGGHGHVRNPDQLRIGPGNYRPLPASSAAAAAAAAAAASSDGGRGNPAFVECRTDAPRRDSVPLPHAGIHGGEQRHAVLLRPLAGAADRSGLAGADEHCALVGAEVLQQRIGHEGDLRAEAEAVREAQRAVRGDAAYGVLCADESIDGLRCGAGRESDARREVREEREETEREGQARTTWWRSPTRTLLHRFCIMMMSAVAGLQSWACTDTASGSGTGKRMKGQADQRTRE